MAKNNSFFKVLKQFATGEEDPPEVKQIKKDLPANEKELEDLMSQINPEFLEKKPKDTGSGTSPSLDISKVVPLNKEPIEDSKLYLAEIGHMIKNLEKMDKPGPKHAYFQFLSARDEMGDIMPETESAIYKAIFQGLKMSPELKTITGDLLVKDAERQLHHASEFAKARVLKIKELHEKAKLNRQREIKELSDSNKATQSVIAKLMKEIEGRNKKIIELETEEATSARDFVLENQASSKAAQKVVSQINADIPKLRRYFTSGAE